MFSSDLAYFDKIESTVMKIGIVRLKHGVFSVSNECNLLSIVFRISLLMD